ncbi:hypothetical protein V6C03_06470 [Methyloligella sp. 2.7D]|uniref:hypothetical protein n=1 Tax=unclassified Methyloligella TaxID=2625955 RepID=UPI00157C9E8B|nr:hypothetical protein [Methyloligella sp. GL2]QKP78453.1 hypothetical protein HT051_13980 [Methyloligella sp. GL2]
MPSENELDPDNPEWTSDDFQNARPGHELPAAVRAAFPRSAMGAAQAVPWLKILDAMIAISAFLAALFWFFSASGGHPPMKSYWGAAPADDPFFLALKDAVFWNFWGALFSGISATFLCGRALLAWRCDR